MPRELRSLRVGPLYVMWGLHPGGWFRLFGWGLSLSNHKHERPLFSERYGKGNRRYFHFGDWCLSTLRPLPKSKPTCSCPTDAEIRAAIHHSHQQLTGGNK